MNYELGVKRAAYSQLIHCKSIIILRYMLYLLPLKKKSPETTTSPGLSGNA